jgi:hypothetical protein
MIEMLKLMREFVALEIECSFPWCLLRNLFDFSSYVLISSHPTPVHLCVCVCVCVCVWVSEMEAEFHEISLLIFSKNPNISTI